MLRAIAKELWVYDFPSSLLGLKIGARMTVLRLSDGRLWLHSPVPIDSELQHELAELGPVGFIVAPNKFHHLHVAKAVLRHPEATVYGAPGLSEKRKDLIFHRELNDTPPPDWKEDLDQIVFAGAPSLNEVMFLHRASGTLILTDLAFNLGASPSRLTRWWANSIWLMGPYGPSRLIKLLLRDRAAARASIDRMLDWDFDRMIVSHGEVLERGARDALRRAYDWL